MNNARAYDKGVSIIIPVYNEEKHIVGVLTDLFKVLPTVGLPYEVIVVDDASQDSSAKEAARFSINLLRHARNQGYGCALKTGIKHARYEYVLFVDGDGQHPVCKVPEFVRGLVSADAVIGERSTGNTHRVTRYWGKLFLRFIALIFLGLPIKDPNCGFRAFRTEVIKKYLHLLPDGFSASMTSTLIAYFRKYQMVFIPVEVSIPKGRSKLHEIRDGFKALNQIMRMSMLFVPWRIFGMSGIVLIMGGFLYGVCVFFKVQTFPPSAVMLISTGISSIFFGLMMDQIAEIRKGRFED
jgi:glycosyltransferase involved in cell wall biosynthesis